MVYKLLNSRCRCENDVFQKPRLWVGHGIEQIAVSGIMDSDENSNGLQCDEENNGDCSFRLDRAKLEFRQSGLEGRRNWLRTTRRVSQATQQRLLALERVSVSDTGIDKQMRIPGQQHRNSRREKRKERKKRQRRVGWNSEEGDDSAVADVLQA